MERPDTRYARSGDVSIAYQSVGDPAQERTFLVCPGFVSNVELCWAEPLFHRLIERAAAYSRVLLFDKRGTGLSDPVSAPPTFEERMDDIRAVLDDAEVDRVVLHGMSEGGAMAMLFAATYPERVTHLSLYGTFASGPEVWSDDERAEEYRRTVWRGFVEALDHWGEGQTIDTLARKVAHRPLERRLWAAWERSGSSPGVVRHLVQSVWSCDVRHALPLISAPTLVTHFEDDYAIPAWCAHEVADAIEGAKLVVLSGGDHVPFNLADLDRVCDEVELFVTGVRPAAPADRQLLTVVFTDIVASTERAAELGDAAWGELVRSHDRVVRSLLTEHEGREVKTLGDGFLATFAGPGRAVAFAISIRDQIRALGLEVRIGVHTGECDVTSDDIRGLAVNIASRVCSVAAPGEAVVTSTVRDLIAGSGVVTTDRGTHALKGVPGEWQLAAVGAPAPAPAGALLPTSTPARRMSDRFAERLAHRYPKVMRAGVRAARAVART